MDERDFIMQVTLEKDATGVLGIPYGEEDTPKRRFWNLKDSPSLIDKIPEVSTYPELKAFLLEVASPDSRFCTFGCEKWEKEVDYGNGLTHEAGLYVDFAFDYREIASNKDNYFLFVDSVKDHGKVLSENDKYSNLGLIKFEPKRAGLIYEDFPFWILTAWIYGAGNSIEMAKKFRTYGLKQLFKCMEQESIKINDSDTSSLTKLLQNI